MLADFSSVQHFWHVANLLFHLLGRSDRLRDYLAQNLAVTFAQALHGGFDGGFGRSQTDADLRVRQRPGLARLEIFQCCKQGSLSDRAVFRGEAIERRCSSVCCPSTFKNLVRRQLIYGFEEVTLLTGRHVERNEYTITAALLCPGPPGVGVVAGSPWPATARKLLRACFENAKLLLYRYCTRTCGTIDGTDANASNSLSN